ncbi:MAG: aminotransferase class IV, partial [Bdellovibrionales bacterium]|nr:aminotransferase class IV [Massilia sp.]
ALYANSTRVMREAQARGYDNGVVLDSAGAVAEFATSNLFLVTAEGKLVTPVPNGTFLAGITRARVITLLTDAGVAVQERTVLPEELDSALEIFNTGNYGKVTPCVRYEGRTLAAGPMASLARERYLAYAKSH